MNPTAKNSILDCMSDQQKLACNRTPFETTDSCDRGSVDIGVFSALPLCELIDPPRPDWAPPTFDFPVVPFAPPPCVCINIEASAEGEMEARDDIELKLDFKADGDCCEGNYKADVDIKIPCIGFTIEGGSESYSVEFDDIPCDSSPTGTLNLGIDVESCAVLVNPKLKLNLPKPPEYKFKTKLKMETVCGLESASGKFVFESSGDACERIKTAKLELKIPKPPTYNLTSELKLDTVCGLDEAEGAFAVESTDLGCGKSFNAKLELKVPKPITYTFETSCSINRICGVPPDIDASELVRFWYTAEGEDCNERIIQHVKMDIPCMMFDVTGADEEKDLEIEYECDIEKPEGKINLGLTTDCCNLNFNPQVSLKLPKPPEYKVKIEPKFEITCVAADFWKVAHRETTTEDDCEVTLKDDITIKVPPLNNLKVVNNDKRVRMTGGLGGTGTLDMGAVPGACDPEVPDLIAPTLTLNLPCPLDDLELSGDGSGGRIGTASKMYIRVTKSLGGLDKLGFDHELGFDGNIGFDGLGSDSACEAKWGIHLITPETYTGEVKFLTGIRFSGGKFEPITGTMHFIDGLCASVEADSPEIDIPTAKHVNRCCEDPGDEAYDWYDPGYDTGDAADGD